MAGLQPEQQVEVIDKAVILDDLNRLPDVEVFDLVSGEEPIDIGYASARVGSLATAAIGNGNFVDLRGVLAMEESASLYGIIRVTRPGHWEGGHMAVVQMGAYNDDPARGVGILHPKVGDFKTGTDDSLLAFRPNGNGSVGVSYSHGSDRDAVVEGFVRPATQSPTEMLQVPRGMWVPDVSTDKHMQWMTVSRPMQG